MSTIRKIYIISDATGQSGLHILRAALVQFEHARTKILLFHDIDTKAGLKIMQSSWPHHTEDNHAYCVPGKYRACFHRARRACRAASRQQLWRQMT